MKIALICTEKLPVPPVSGGAIQIYINNILPILSKKHEITVFSIQNQKLLSREKQDNITHIRISGKTSDEYINNIKKEIKDEYDLIHVFNRPVWVLRLGEVITNSPISLSLHNEMMLPKKIDPNRAKQCIEKVEFITNVSKFIADDVKRMYPEAESKLNVVYSAVDNNKIRPIWDESIYEDRINMKKQYGLENSKVILFVGRLSKKKGPHVLIRAMEEVMEKHPEAALMFVGSKWYGNNETDDYIKQIQKMAKELKNPVIFTGFLTPDEIPKYYSMGDIFVCASQWREPLARVHYEAMGAGLPIITTDRGGNAEVIEENVNGIVIKDYENPKAFAESINYLLENEEIALSMGRMGRKFAEEKYNWDRVSKQLLDLFDSI